jgi:hypothetical protein
MADERERAQLFPVYMAAVRQVAADESVALFDHLVRWERLRLCRPATYGKLMRDAMHVNPLGNMVLGLDVLRQFGVRVTGETAELCAEGMAVQQQLDELDCTERRPQ